MYPIIGAVSIVCICVLYFIFVLYSQKSCEAPYFVDKNNQRLKKPLGAIHW